LHVAPFPTRRSSDLLTDFADGKLKIPENSNQKNDLLDEARWQVEWMLKMQVPAGQKMAGMVHHKMHDKEWTALGMKPPTQAEMLDRKSTRLNSSHVK